MNPIVKKESKRLFVALSIMGLFLLLSVSCRKDETTTLSGSLNRMNWSDRNHEVLNQLIKEHGIEVFIVSASYKPVVEVFSGIGNFGYNVPSQNVIAMELALDNDGKILAEYKSGWVKTQRQGKVDAINQVIKSGLGKNWDPLFSAADSDGDYEMSISFPDMKLTLIWNRVKSGDIGTLCQLAVDEMNNTNPRYILQGRNENTGMVIPSSESILFGKT